MKLFIRIIVPLTVLGLCIWGDVSLARFLFSKLPDVSWIFWAQAVIVLVIFWLTFGLVVISTVLSGAIAQVLTD